MDQIKEHFSSRSDKTIEIYKKKIRRKHFIVMPMGRSHLKKLFLKIRFASRVVMSVTKAPTIGFKQKERSKNLKQK